MSDYLARLEAERWSGPVRSRNSYTDGPADFPPIDSKQAWRNLQELRRALDGADVVDEVVVDRLANGRRTRASHDEQRAAYQQLRRRNVSHTEAARRLRLEPAVAVMYREAYTEQRMGRSA